MSQQTTNQSFDDLAKGLATGTLSRGKAIRWMGGALLGAALASLPGVAWANDDCRRLGRECRRDSQCCSRNCIRRGDDKVCGCPEGQRRCNDRCVNLDRNERHCGRCFNRCAEGQECVDGVCEGEVCEGELLTPVGGGDPICSCSGFCAASCDVCPSGTICTNGPSECGTPPTLACSTPCGEPICNPPCPFPCGCYARADGPGTVCVDCSVGCQEPVSSCAECTDPQTVCFINDAGGIGCGRPCPPCLPDGRFCFEDANCCSLLCVNNTCGG